MEKMAFRSGRSHATIFGPNLRGRVSAVMKMDAMANGAFDRRIDIRSLRAGGATALRAQGVPLGVIHRLGRWKSLTFHRYLWRDISALNHLSEVMDKSHGLLECLKLMNKHGKQVSFQRKPRNMATGNAPKDT